MVIEGKLNLRGCIILSRVNIYLSPSKQPHNGYAGMNTNEEKEMVVVCQIIAKVLKTEYDCSVSLSTLSLGIGSKERPKEAKELGASLYLAIHSNAGGAGKASGAVALYHPKSSESKKLGEILVDELNKIAPIKSNRSESLVNGMAAFQGRGFGEIRVPYENKMTPLLMETNFHDHLVLAKWITTHHEEIARAYVKGLVAFYNIPKKQVTSLEQSMDKPVNKEEGDKLYRVQVGAFRKKENAEILMARLFNEGFEGFMIYR